MADNLFTDLLPVRNRGVFSSHWLEHRLVLEPEWHEQADAATDALNALEDLWRAERKRVEKYGNEQSLEVAFIQPVLKSLGWRFKYQTYLQGRKPDYALYLSDKDHDAALAENLQSDAFWSPAVSVADAKKWDRSLDKPLKVDGRQEYPPEQIEWYLDRSRKPFGILTNGRVWRLVPRELGPNQRRYQTYLEIDLVAILNDWATGKGKYDAADDFRRFFLFFGTAGFAALDSRKPLLQRAAEGSSEYRLGVGEGLKGNAFDALRLCIDGFLSYEPNRLQRTIELDRARENSFTLLCRLLFIFFAEDRQLLPYKLNSTYTQNRSLGRLRDEIAARLDNPKNQGDYKETETTIWDDLVNLFDLIDTGKKTYGVPAYNGGLFNPGDHPFLTEYKIADWYLARVINGLGRASDPKQRDAGRFRVDYRDLAIQHLGGIYEGLLELRPRIAAERMNVYKRRHKGEDEEIVLPASAKKPEGYALTEETISPGTIFLDTDKRERRAFGSYYTPDNIVDYIVKQTLNPICERLTADIERESQAARRRGESADAIESSFPDRLLEVRVLDPSMGSGHFLLAACQYLAEQLATNPYTPDDIATDDALSYWKRRVIETCLYGVDINSLAVDLAKLALWLETVARDRPLTFLDHHLKHGNSLIGARLNCLGALARDSHLTADIVRGAFDARLPALLKPLAEIREIPSDTVAAVKKKEDRFKAYRKAVEPFELPANLWAADAAGHAVDPQYYLYVAKALDSPGKLKALAADEAGAAAVKVARETLTAFHWDLAFPEVFCTENGGFDAVIGNPPYEVLSQKESGLDPTALKAFVECEPFYRPAIRGKQNLYKLFICRVLNVLRDGGQFGFIVPMALLGDDITSELRRYMVKCGAFLSVDAFPQKDNAEKRVFLDAKLSTTVFAYRKSERIADDAVIRVRTHNERTVEDDTPILKLKAAEIPLYDPANFTIASCEQADWDLAVRLMKTGRMMRLGESVDFFQGEVNETNEKKKGTLTKPDLGNLVIRGAGLCLYIPRPSSQGEELYLNVASFLDGKEPDTKAFHHKYRRVGLQESSPQNNFRRIIASMVPAGEYFNHTVNYCTEESSQIDLRLVIALLNSILADWYFRLGSTNAHVSHYQLKNLPCPIFRDKATIAEKKAGEAASHQLSLQRPDKAVAILAPLTAEAPFSPAVCDVIVQAVGKIIEAESGRGEISRADRSGLSEAAQPFQDFIDAVLFDLAGLNTVDVAGLKQRYEAMKKVK